MFTIFRRKKEAAAQSIDYIIVGLGNPGSKYEMTRHNAGWLAIDMLSERLGAGRLTKTRCRATYAVCTYKDKTLLLMKPQTFMNLSGDAVRDMAESCHVQPQNIIVILDDTALAEGRLRLRRKGSHGGHNGIKDIILKLSCDEFLRVKIGIGSPDRERGEDLADYVLSPLGSDAVKAIKLAPEAVCAIIDSGIDLAMQQYN